jgi:hypothetical protein
MNSMDLIFSGFSNVDGIEWSDGPWRELLGGMPGNANLTIGGRQNANREIGASG